MIEGFNFAGPVDGWNIAGQPLEAYEARREVAYMRDGVRKAGHTGMAITYYPISTTIHAMLAPMDPRLGIRPTDGILLAVLPDVKTDYDSITAGIVYEDYGSYKFNGGPDVFIGGFCGGSEGAVIESIVRDIAALIIYRNNARGGNHLSNGSRSQRWRSGSRTTPMGVFDRQSSVMSKFRNHKIPSIYLCWI